jgi:hypothetical protein
MIHSHSLLKPSTTPTGISDVAAGRAAETARYRGSATAGRTR